jgi:hypothetical protein
MVWGAMIAITPEDRSWSAHMLGHMSWRHGVNALRARLWGPLDAQDVRQMMEAWLVQERNPRLKLGPITAKDENTFEADIVTKDDSLVQRFAVDRRTGALRALED